MYSRAGGDRGRGCGLGPHPQRPDRWDSRGHTSMQQLWGLLFALGRPGGRARLCGFLPSIHTRRLSGHLRPAPASRVAAHWGRARLVGAVGQGGGEKAEAATCGYRQDCGERAPGGLSQISSPQLFSPLSHCPSCHQHHLTSSSSSSITPSRAPRASTHVGATPKGLGEGGQGFPPLPLHLLLV